MSTPNNAGAPAPKSKLKKLVRYGAIAGLVVGVGLQLVPVDGIGVNPPDRFKVDAPPDVEAILKRACFDCHTNETEWPLYSRIAPGLWLMIRDVKKGRARFNMSEWGDSDEETRAIDKENSWELIEKGEMPPWFYVFPLHPGAKLSEEDKAKLKAWLLKPAEKKPAEKAPEKAEDKAADTGGDKAGGSTGTAAPTGGTTGQGGAADHEFACSIRALDSRICNAALMRFAARLR